MIKEAVHEYAMKLGKEFAHDRSLTVGASEIGLCERRVILTKRGLIQAKLQPKKRPSAGEPAPIEMTGSWGAHVRGSVMEESFWVPALEARWGKRLAWIGRDQKSFARGNLSATPDGILTGVKNELREFGIKTVKSGCVLVECKTIDPRVTLRQAKAENRFQVQIQMGLVRDLTKYKPDYAVISYTNASFWDEVEEYAVEFDPKIYAAGKARADKIMGLAQSADFKIRDATPEGIVAGGRECEYCPFARECYADVKDVPKYEVDPRMIDDKQWLAMIEDRCREVLDLEEEGEEIGKCVTKAKLEIKDELRKANVRKIKGVVSWSPVKGSSRYDNKAIREAAAAAGVDVESMKSTGDPTDRFEILLK